MRYLPATQTGSVVVLPFLASLFPTLQHNPDRQGLATAALFVAAGLLLGVGRLGLDLRDRRRGGSPSAL
jgi:hypothetical protein